MSNILKLNCLILEEDINEKNIFIIKIADDKAVDDIKDAIKEKLKPKLDHISVTTLDIYRVSFFIDNDILKEELRKFGQNVINPLRPVAKLSKSFSNLSDEYLHVVVKVWPSADAMLTEKIHLGMTPASTVMSNTLKFNCLILEEDIDLKNIFTIGIADTVTVGGLKHAINTERRPMVDNFGSSNLDIYKVSFLINKDSLKEEVRKFGQEVIDVEDPLLPVADLSELFSDLDKKYLHVIVKIPPDFARQNLLCLWCYVVGDDPKDPFSVETAPTVSVDALKGMIKEIKRPRFDAIPTSTLELYSVSIPSTESGQLGSLDKKTLPSELLATRILSEVFSNSLAPNHIHIVVVTPDNDPRAAKRRKLNRRDAFAMLEEYVPLYWKIPLASHLTDLPDNLKLDLKHEDSDDLLPGDAIIKCFSPDEILIRTEYVRAYDIMKESCNERHALVFILTGQPGIGKTVWITYAIRRRLGEGQPVFWYRSGKYYFLSGTGVSEVDEPMDIPLRNLDISTNVWCFVDADALTPLPPDICDSSSKYSIIYVSSPSEDRWKHIHQLRALKVHVMDPWTRAEIEKAASMDRYGKLDRDKIFERFENAGPIARLCLSLTNDMYQMWVESRDASIWEANNKVVKRLLATQNSLPISALAHKICLVRRSYLNKKGFSVEPISRTVMKLLIKRLLDDTEENRHELIRCFARIPSAGGMVGWLFEAQSHQRFVKEIRLIARPMFQLGCGNSCWHALLGAVFPPRGYVEIPLPISISPKDNKTYVIQNQKNQEESIKIDIKEDVYYIPSGANQEGIDSLIVHSNCLYLFQITVGQQHNFFNCKMILDSFSGLPSNRYFIFVIPNSAKDFSCPKLEGDLLSNHPPYVAYVDDDDYIYGNAKPKT